MCRKCNAMTSTHAAVRQAHEAPACGPAFPGLPAYTRSADREHNKQPASNFSTCGSDQAGRVDKCPLAVGRDGQSFQLSPDESPTAHARAPRT